MIIIAAIQIAVLATALAGVAWNQYLAGKEKRARHAAGPFTCQVKLFRPDQSSDAQSMRRAA